MNTYRVAVRRDEHEKWWIVTSPDVPGAVTQVRRLDRAGAAARNVIALALDTADDSFDLDVRYDFPDQALDADVAHYRALRSQIAELQEEAFQLSCETALALVRTHGWSMRETATVLGISHQRVQQLVSGPTKASRDDMPTSVPSRGEEAPSSVLARLRHDER